MKTQNKYICSCHNREFKNKNSLNTHFWQVKNPKRVKENQKKYDANLSEKQKERHRINISRWSKENPEKVKLNTQKNNSSNKISGYSKNFYQNHKEKRKKYSLDYYYKHKKECSKYMFKYNKENSKERVLYTKKYKNTFKGKLVTKGVSSNRRVNLQNSSKLTSERVFQVYKKCTNELGQYVCVCCFGVIIPGQEELEHNIPVTRVQDFLGVDLNSVENLGLAHGIDSQKKCNKKKHSKTLEEWFQLHPEYIRR